jgi:hypothetical protein
VRCRIQVETHQNGIATFHLNKAETFRHAAPQIGVGTGPDRAGSTISRRSERMMAGGTGDVAVPADQGIEEEGLAQLDLCFGRIRNRIERLDSVFFEEQFQFINGLLTLTAIAVGQAEAIDGGGKD